MKKQKKDYQFSINSLRRAAQEATLWSEIKTNFGFASIEKAQQFCKKFDVQVNLKKVSHKRASL